MVRKGNYAILEIFKPYGIYGRLNARGLTAYFDRHHGRDPVLLDHRYLRGPDRSQLGGAGDSVIRRPACIVDRVLAPDP